MPAYLVTLDRTKTGHTLVTGANAQVVFAASPQAALEAAAAKFDGDGLSWLEDGTATEIVAGADWEGWTFAVGISGIGAVEVTGTETDNTVDEIAALLVVALNGLEDVDNAAYNGTTNVLTAAGSDDALGDHVLTVTITPPDGASPIPSLVGTIVDGGDSGDPLTVVLPADGAVVPVVLAALKQE